MSPSPVSHHLVSVVLLIQLLFGASANDVFVGEQFIFYCGGMNGYWRHNGSPIGVMGPSYSSNATVNLDGVYTCTDQDGTVSYASANLRVFGLVGVSPSPHNCSSTDNSTNTCTVSASVSPSITLCADFTQLPPNASRYAELVTMLWEQVTNDGSTTIWRCQENQCSNDSPPVGYHYSDNWGRCLHVDRVEANSVFRYKVYQLTPPKPYPAGFTGIVHREVSFSVQVLPTPTASTTITTTHGPFTSDVGSERPGVSSELTNSSVSVTPSIGPILPQSPSNELAVAIPIAVVFLIVVGLAISAIVVMAVCLRKKGYWSFLSTSTSESIIDPSLQQMEGNKSRPCELFLEGQYSNTNSNLPTYSSPSSQRPLLPPEQATPQNSIGLPSYRTATNQPNGHPPPHPLAASNGMVHNVYCAEPATPHALSSRASNRDSQLTDDLPGIENSPECFA